MGKETIIEIKNVTYTYPLTQKPAIQNMTCSFEKGKCYGIIGPNASGKTTLSNMIRGMVPHFYKGELEGELLIEGKEVREWTDAEFSTKIGYVFQDPFAQISGVKETVFEEIGLGLENLGVELSKMVDVIMHTAKLVKVDHLLDKHPLQLSGGQCQRVAFASILVMDSDVIVIDEPTSQLDPNGTRDIFEIIESIKKENKTIFIAEHKIDHLVRHCDELVAMSEGRIIAKGKCNEVLCNEDVLAAGITRPQSMDLADDLKKAGSPLAEMPLTKEEAVQLIRQRIGGKVSCPLYYEM